MVAFLFVLAGPVQVLPLHGLVGALIPGFAGTLVRLGRKS
jgi:hypothetical protein